MDFAAGGRTPQPRSVGAGRLHGLLPHGEKSAFVVGVFLTTNGDLGIVVRKESCVKRDRLIAIAEEGDEKIAAFSDHVIRVPVVPTLMQPLVSTVPLQVFACEMATAKGHDVDQPRNLAKSVTVE